MSETKVILKAENISKQYRLGLVGTGTLGDDLKRFWYNMRGKSDPFLQVGDSNDRTTLSDSKYVWALQDINFEVKEGEVLGIIGKNGAGKSTLLKILSRVTSPTVGEIKTKGRIASLLEVGTGFHPELTGLENIFLNGAILGMTKNEIKSKIDEIVSFSGCERYIDTPVKRYSSGMRVRLAFAVAAHLEPEILVIDEVLAVGDAEFQKKAIGKMQDISRGQGRTVLFVSHNMAAVKSLCTRAIVLEHGKVVFEGDKDNAVEYYLNSNYQNGSSQKSYYFDESVFNDKSFNIKHIGVKGVGKEFESPINRQDSIVLNIEIEKNEIDRIVIVYVFKDSSGQKIFATNSDLDNQEISYVGFKSISMHIPSLFFNEGVFSIDVMITDGKNQLFFLNDVLNFAILEEEKELGSWMGKSPGFLKPRFQWEL